MIRNVAALISLAVVFSGSFALSTQSVEAKTSRNSSRKARNYFVPPPPPYIPLMVRSELGVTYVQSVTAHADQTLAEKQVNPYSIYTRNQGDMPKVVQPDPLVSYQRGVEKRMLKDIDYFDSEISSSEKEISKLLNL